MTGWIVECPIDEMNKPRGRKQAALRIPPTDAEIRTLFTGWRQELVDCRKFAPTARNGTVNLLKLSGGTGMAGSGESVCGARVRPLWPCR